MIKIILFINDIHPYGEALVNELKKRNYSCIKTTNPDEVDQVGKQMGKAVLIFHDAQFAYNFIKDKKWEGFPCLYLLNLQKKPNLNEKNQTMLSSVGLKILHPDNVEVELGNLQKFMESKDSSEISSDDIEFNVNILLKDKL